MGIINKEKRKKVYKRIVMKRAPKGTSIEKRPIEIKERKNFGHWEMDCVCGKTKSTLLVLSERLTRKEIIFKMENQKSNSVIKCLNSLEKSYGKKFIYTIRKHVQRVLLYCSASWRNLTY